MEALRREGDRVVPAGPKARRTRAQLIDAATSLFAERGFQNTAVAEIAEAAGVSLGTFYQYFRNRDEVLGAMVHDQLEWMSATTGTGWRVCDGVEGLERMLSIYVKAYTRTIDLSRVWEAVSLTEPEMVAIRREAGRSITGRLAAELVRAGKAGEMRKLTKRQATLTARALAGMMDRVCFDMFVFDPPEPRPTEAEVASLVAGLWANALGLPLAHP
ncbi:MAG TPA: helix-turn-helix domain-containing protein [Acidimicrobiales bacterium]|nr:helix-turn-helix domain-containing protein [Acidimicrobiales bacterium]